MSVVVYSVESSAIFYKYLLEYCQYYNLKCRDPDNEVIEKLVKLDIGFIKNGEFVVEPCKVNMIKYAVEEILDRRNEVLVVIVDSVGYVLLMLVEKDDYRMLEKSIEYDILVM